MKRLILAAIVSAFSLASNAQVTVTPGAGVGAGQTFIYTGTLAGIPATCTDTNLAWVTDATPGENIYGCIGGAWEVQGDGAGTGTPGGVSGDFQTNNGAGGFGALTPGAGVAAALGVDIGSAGAPVLFGGALGAPTSGDASNLTGTAAGLTVGAATTATSAGASTNIAGGSSGQIPYQTGAGATGFDAGLAFNDTTKALGIVGPISSGQAGTGTGSVALLGTTSGSITIAGQAVGGTNTITAPAVTGNMAVTTGALVDGNCAKFDASGRIVDNGAVCGGGGGSGDVVGPASATDNAFARFDSTTGKLLKNSTVTQDASGNTSFPGAVVGNDLAVQVVNSDNTDPLSSARLHIESGGTSAGDAKATFRIGAAGQAFGLGIDNSASDAFVLSRAVDLGANNVFSVDTNGRLTFFPSVTTPGINVGSVSADPSTPSDGDIWYQSTDHFLRARINGVDQTLVHDGNSAPFTDPGFHTALCWDFVTGQVKACDLTYSPQFITNTIELGDTGDTTLARFAAGVMTVEGVAVPTVSSTDTLTNKTIDAASNVIKSKGYIQLTHPGFVDGTGCTIGTTSTVREYGRPTCSGTADQAANYFEWDIRVPDDIDTAVPLRAWIKFKKTATDTATHRYVLSSVSVADGAVLESSTLANAINLDFAGSASASGAVEGVGPTTLTGWAAALTAGQTWRIRGARDGDAATVDASTVSSTITNVTIEYGKTQ